MPRILLILLFTYCLDLSSARPAEEPTRFILSTVKSDTENVLSSTLEQGKELLGNAADTIRIVRGRFVNSLILARNFIVDRAERLATSEIQDNSTTVITTFDKPNKNRRSTETLVQNTTPAILLVPMRRETARLENETAQAILELRKPDNVRQVLNNFLRPTPIVDGIQEQEKYGNTGDKFIGIGRAVVNSYESLSNFLNAIVDFPVTAARQTSRGITEALNQIGARIIGLQ